MVSGVVWELGGELRQVEGTPGGDAGGDRG